jgi:tetratricopeptide (TPR) repeat protein
MLPAPAVPPPAPAASRAPTKVVNAPSHPAEETALHERELVRALVDEASDAAKKNDLQRALALFTEAIRRSPTDVYALIRRCRLYSRDANANWPAAIADASEAIRLDPGNSWAYASRAYAEERAGDQHRAIADASEAIRLDPKNAEAIAVRADAYSALGEWNHAILDFNESLRLNPKRDWTWSNRANAYMALGNFEHAQNDNRRAVELAPTYFGFWLQRAVIHGLKNEDEQAVTSFAEAMRLAPESEKATVYNGRANFELSVSKIDPAIADSSEVIRLRGHKSEPIDAEYHARRAKLHLAKGETDLALADCDVAIRINPKPPKPHFYRGRLICGSTSGTAPSPIPRARSDSPAQTST